ncbi:MULTISPECIES: multidrug effflux MFS transporter [unclassified Pseudomonas]|uniref:multidrug effflux MFS transporter n=1 Tax=unclassified Pseudomonas TaxID=196821 RepID=UPI000CCFFCEB|nr:MULTISPECIES: multidrug effflux MFS transporter [unclassified Pseudomonas]POA31296.1 Bcr/CflA family drug resistance efflux transporter [Pseudomonas sp. GW456-R21]POA65513.1 Bcr/CflA family drug resistance efflux transporter [Pseudomonas sp. GW460-R15]
MPVKSNLAPWIWSALLLVVVCLPRVTIDIYLPALPAMADALRASDAQLQLTLTLYMVGYAFSMLIGGPLCDRFGRRPVLIGGTALYLMATLMCALARDVEVLIVARMLQALGGCCGTVIGRVMVRDRFDRHEQTRLLSRISMGMAISPMVAPMIGSLIETAFGWRGVFAVLSVIAALTLILISLLLPETRPSAQPDTRQQGTLRIYARLLRDRYFLRYSLAIGCVYCTYFPFIAESSTLLQRTLHLSSMEYAQVFAVTVAGYVLGSNLFRRLSARHDADTLIGYAITLNLVGSLLLIMATRLWPEALLSIVCPMLLIMLSVGIAIPACQLAVLQPFSAIAGTASGLFFFIQMAMTAVCGFVTGKLSDGSVYPMMIMTSIYSISFCLVWLLFKTETAPQEEALGER